MPITHRQFFCLLLPLACHAVRADWLSDIGHTKLAAEIGTAMPTGAGIVLVQSEANNIASPPNYLPQAGGPDPFAGIGSFAGKTFYPESGTGTDLGHAAAVATFFYGSGIGVARGATDIHNYTAIDFITRLTDGIAPEVFPGRVQNHSWAGSLGDVDEDLKAIRAFDFMLDRDRQIAVTGLSGGSLAPLLGSTYHAIAAGTRSAAHSQTGTTTDGIGRMKPDLVVDVQYTSYASAIVAGSAAALLQEAITAGNAAAERPQLLKAVLIAGASKRNLPQWQRDAAAEPYDDIFGAGELDLYHAWHLLKSGQQPHSTSVERSMQGWDFATSTTDANGRRYFFTVPECSVAETFSAALVWHRVIMNVFGSSLSFLPDLNLKLYAASGFNTGAVISSSTSSVDNVEHLFLRHLPAGQYCLEVTAVADGYDFALAWQAVPGIGPRVTSRISSGQLFIDAASLDPLTTYTLETAPDLSSAWTTVETFRTADDTASFTHTWTSPTAPATRQFFRLRWTPVRVTRTQ